MKFTLLLLPLFIAICAAVSKSHLSLRKSTTQGSVQISIPGGVSLNIRGTVSSPNKQRITVKNNQGLSYTWEGAGEGDVQIGQVAGLNVPAGGYSWTVTMEYNQGGGWKPSKVTAPQTPYVTGPYTQLTVFADNGDDNDYNDAIVYFVYMRRV